MPVIVNVLEPVEMIPSIIFTTAADISLCKINSVVGLPVWLFRLLKVVGPLIYAVAGPKNSTVLVPAVKFPLLFQFPYIEWVCEEALKFVPDPIVKLWVVVIFPVAVFVLPFDKTRLL